jgi:hypothetical protein
VKACTPPLLSPSGSASSHGAVSDWGTLLLSRPEKMAIGFSLERREREAKAYLETNWRGHDLPLVPGTVESLEP